METINEPRKNMYLYHILKNPDKKLTMLYNEPFDEEYIGKVGHILNGYDEYGLVECNYCYFKSVQYGNDGYETSLTTFYCEKCGKYNSDYWETKICSKMFKYSGLISYGSIDRKKYTSAKKAKYHTYIFARKITEVNKEIRRLR